MILVLDDLCTSGRTMRNCIEAILAAVVAAWDRLSLAVRAGIVAMVRAAAGR
jgi:hypothetical protein